MVTLELSDDSNIKYSVENTQYLPNDIKPHPHDVIGSQGDYDPKRTKVLQFTMNPFSAAHRKLTAELEQLREENRRLTKRLQIMEESRGFAVSDLSARVDNELHASTGKEVEGIETAVHLITSTVIRTYLLTLFSDILAGTCILSILLLTFCSSDQPLVAVLSRLLALRPGMPCQKITIFPCWP